MIEIYALRVLHNGGLVPPCDGDVGAFLAWTTLEDAEAGLKYQQENWLEGEPVEIVKLVNGQWVACTRVQMN